MTVRNTTYRDNDRFGLKKERVEEIRDEEKWRVATLGLGEGGQQQNMWLRVGIPAHRVQQSVGAMTEIKAGAARSLAAGVGAEKTPLFPLLRRSFYAAEHADLELII